MQTRGPIEDYAKYTAVTSHEYVRPLTNKEITDAAATIYRGSFKVIGLATLLSSTLIAAFLAFMFLYVIPRGTETQFESNAAYQVGEFLVVIVGGLSIGFLVSLFGFAKLTTICHFLTHGYFTGKEYKEEELESAVNAVQLKTIPVILRSGLYTFSVLVLSLLPLLISGVWSAFAPKSLVAPGYLGILSLCCIPIGFCLMLVRLGTSLCSVSVALAESLPAAEALKRAKALLKPRPGIDQGGNPLGAMSVIILCIYIALILSIQFGLQLIGWEAGIPLQGLSPLVKVVGETAVGLLPHFLVIWLAAPYLCIAACVYYWQRRVVVEGYDITLLYEQIPPSRR